MILLQGRTNTALFTLSESTTITASTPYYLFEFTSPSTKQSKLFTAQDTSTNTVRYNRFNITLTGGTENLTGGTVTLVPDGHWLFNVYQMTGQTNVSLSGVYGGPIQTGYALVSGTTLGSIASNYTGSSYTYTYYNG